MKTPETDNLARGNHVVPTEWAEQLERERDEARKLAEAFHQDQVSLLRERDEAREALSKIDEIFCDGEDTHDDWMKMGIIAKDYLKGLE